MNVRAALRYIKVRAQQLFYSDTSPSRIFLGFGSIAVGLMFIGGAVNDMDTAMYAALVQFMQIQHLGVLALIAGLLAVNNAFFRVRDMHLRTLEHIGTVAFWAICAFHSLYSHELMVNYGFAFVLAFWMSLRMDDDGLE